VSQKKLVKISLSFSKMFGTKVYVMGRAIKIGQNLWVNPAHHKLESSWVEFFYKF